MVVPAPVQRRPYDSMESPYPTSCSRLCNHPVSKDIKREYRDAMKKVKDSHVSYLRLYGLRDEYFFLKKDPSDMFFYLNRSEYRIPPNLNF